MKKSSYDTTANREKILRALFLQKNSPLNLSAELSKSESFKRNPGAFLTRWAEVSGKPRYFDKIIAALGGDLSEDRIITSAWLSSYIPGSRAKRFKTVLAGAVEGLRSMDLAVAAQAIDKYRRDFDDTKRFEVRQEKKAQMDDILKMTLSKDTTVRDVKRIAEERGWDPPMIYRALTFINERSKKRDKPTTDITPKSTMTEKKSRVPPYSVASPPAPALGETDMNDDESTMKDDEFTMKDDEPETKGERKYGVPGMLDVKNYSDAVKVVQKIARGDKAARQSEAQRFFIGLTNPKFHRALWENASDEQKKRGIDTFYDGLYRDYAPLVDTSKQETFKDVLGQGLVDAKKNFSTKVDTYTPRTHGSYNAVQKAIQEVADRIRGSDIGAKVGELVGGVLGAGAAKLFGGSWSSVVSAEAIGSVAGNFAQNLFKDAVDSWSDVLIKGATKEHFVNTAKNIFGFKDTVTSPEKPTAVGPSSMAGYLGPSSMAGYLEKSAPKPEEKSAPKTEEKSDAKKPMSFTEAMTARLHAKATEDFLASGETFIVREPLGISPAASTGSSAPPPASLVVADPHHGFGIPTALEESKGSLPEPPKESAAGGGDVLRATAKDLVPDESKLDKEVDAESDFVPDADGIDIPTLDTEPDGSGSAPLPPPPPPLERKGEHPGFGEDPIAPNPDAEDDVAPPADGPPAAGPPADGDDVDMANDAASDMTEEKTVEQEEKKAPFHPVPVDISAVIAGYPLLRPEFNVGGEAKQIQNLNSNPASVILDRMQWQDLKNYDWESNREEDNPLFHSLIREENLRFSYTIPDDPFGVKEKECKRIIEDLTPQLLETELPRPIRARDLFVGRKIDPYEHVGDGFAEGPVYFHETNIPSDLELPSNHPLNILSAVPESSLCDYQLETGKFVPPYAQPFQLHDDWIRTTQN